MAAIQKRFNLFFVDKELMAHIFNIATCHTGEDAIAKNIPFNEDYCGYPLNLQFLAALLRLADELEEGED